MRKIAAPARRDKGHTGYTGQDIIAAHFIIETAEQHGIRFRIENGDLAIFYPLNADRQFLCEIKRAIWANRQTIANYIFSRELGII